MKKLFITPLIIFLSIIVSFASNIHVPSDYPNIQEAINNAFEGDVIIVAPGTYTGEGNYNISFYGKQLELVSETGPENTIIDCEGLGRAFEFYSGEVNTSILDGFTITNGYVDNEMGAGIKCMFSSPTINNCIFEGFDIGWGSILYFTNNTSHINNCTFTNNNISQGGRVLYFDSSWEIEFNDNLFYENTLYETAQLVYIVNTDVLMERCKFFGNSTAHTAIKLWNNSVAEIVNCYITDFLSYGAYGSNESNVFVSNSLLRNMGTAAIAAFDHCQLHSFSNTITGNTIGIYSDNCGVGIYTSLIYNNNDFQLYLIQGDYPIPYARYNNVQDRLTGGVFGPITWAQINIDEDPIFIDPDGDEISDYYLQFSSPCINIGEPDTDFPDLDILGHPRIYGGIRDIGAIEYQGNLLEILTSASTEEICSAQAVILNSSVMGGSGTYTYSWTSTPQGYTSSESNPIVYPETTTTYHLEVSDGNLTDQSSVEITVFPIPANATEIVGPTAVCKGEANILFAISEIENADNYEWILPEGFIITSGDNTNNIIVSIGNNATDGQISVKGINDCGSGNQSTLDVSVHYVLANAGIDQNIDYENSTVLNGDATDGSGDYSWSWEPTNMLVESNIQNPQTIDLTSNTEFILTVTDNTYGCADTDQMNVLIETDELTVVATADPEEIEFWEDSQLDAIANGGTLNYNYSWTSYPEGFESNIVNPIVSPAYTTIYYVEVDDSENTATSEVTLFVYAPPAPPSQPTGADSVELVYTDYSEYFINPIPSALTYQWNLSPENAGILVPAGNNVTIQWNQEFAGWCYLTVSAVNEYGESEYSETLEIYVDQVINVQELSTNSFQVFPNPTTGLVSIKSPQEINEILIMDISGQVILQEKHSSNGKNTSVSFENYADGIYFIKIIGIDSESTQKVIKH